MYKPVNIIKVYCWGEYVGALALDQGSGYYAFEYDPRFRARGVELAPLALPLREPEQQVFTHLPEKTYYRLPPFIADSLPDNFGNSLVNAWMATQGIAPGAITALDRLAYTGSRGMGALEYVPAIREVNKARPNALEMNELVNEARRAVEVGLATRDAHESDTYLAQLIGVGTSAGGARAKAVVGFDPLTEKFVSGQFDVPPGYQHWIIKFDVSSTTPGDLGGSREYGRIEYAYYLMARDCGITMEQSRLYEAGGRAHFMTRRFDRGEHNERHHIQTLCAMAQLDFNQLHTHDYAQLFMTAAELNLPLATHDEIFRRMAFNVACANNDDHTKNHSFRLKRNSIWELSPAYDITHAHGVDPDSWTRQHSIGVGGVFSDITREDVLALAQRYSVRNPKGLLDSVLAIVDNWAQYARESGLSAYEKDRVGSDIRHCSALLRK
ncbi:MAG: type II toxin-antitoxin system HipA family toxin [Coriobacteriia bacterium]|nr:type II toxin-antitoxin system HipA family toxin [Coriobacteriia bacterium]